MKEWIKSIMLLKRTVSSLFLGLLIMIVMTGCSNDNKEPGLNDMSNNNQGPELNSMSNIDYKPGQNDMLQFQTQYKVKGDLDVNNDILKFEQTVTVSNTGEIPMNELYFHLYANIYQSLTNKGKVEIVSVKDSKGKDVNFQMKDDDQLMQIVLSDPIRAGENEELEFEVIVELPEVYDRYGVSEEEYLLAFFYPQLAVFDEDGWDLTPMSLDGDGRYSTVSDYSVQITVPNEYGVACSGKLISSQSKEKKTTYIYEANKYRDIVLTISDQYEQREIQSGDVMILGYFHRDESEKVKQGILELAKHTLEYFSEQLIEYPYETLVIASINAPRNYSMEFTGFINLQQQMVFDDNCKQTLIHEIAHQWFYGIVGNNEYQEPWLDEAFAEFMTGICLKELYGNDVSDIYFILMKQIVEMVPLEGKVENVNGSVKDYSTSDFCNVVYYRGAYFLTELQEAMGEHNFMTALSQYCKTYAYQTATTDQFVNIMKEYSNEDIEAIVNKYIK